MFSETDLEVFGAFSLVLSALLWFLGYLILQVRSYKRMYRQEVEYNKALAQAEAERSRMALQTMEKVRETMKQHMDAAARDRQEYLREIKNTQSKGGDTSS